MKQTIISLLLLVAIAGKGQDTATLPTKKYQTIQQKKIDSLQRVERIKNDWPELEFPPVDRNGGMVFDIPDSLSASNEYREWRKTRHGLKIIYLGDLKAKDTFPIEIQYRDTVSCLFLVTDTTHYIHVDCGISVVDDKSYEKLICDSVDRGFRNSICFIVKGYEVQEDRHDPNIGLGYKQIISYLDEHKKSLPSTYVIWSELQIKKK